ncbi:MAG TPA: hypothetical protein PKH33_00075 [bacterium]|nr:hypothetical protein [bacterium]
MNFSQNIKQYISRLFFMSVIILSFTATCIADMEKDISRCYELDRWLTEARYGRDKWHLDKDWLRLYKNALFAETGTMLKSPELKFLHDCKWFGRSRNEESHQAKEREIVISFIDDVMQGKTENFEIYSSNMKLEHIALKTLAALKSRDKSILSELFANATYSSSLASEWVSEDKSAQLTANMILNMTDNYPLVYFQVSGCCGEEDGPVEKISLTERLFKELFNWEENFKYLVFAPVHSMCESEPPMDIMFTFVAQPAGAGQGYNYGCESSWFQTSYFCDKDIQLHSMPYQVRFVLEADKRGYCFFPTIKRIDRIDGYCP